MTVLILNTRKPMDPIYIISVLRPHTETLSLDNTNSLDLFTKFRPIFLAHGGLYSVHALDHSRKRTLCLTWPAHPTLPFDTTPQQRPNASPITKASFSRTRQR